MWLVLVRGSFFFFLVFAVHRMVYDAVFLMEEFSRTGATNRFDLARRREGGGGGGWQSVHVVGFGLYLFYII